MKKSRHLTIDEKRDWLAEIFRDTQGEYSQADKFKALVEDTRLAALAEEAAREEKAEAAPPEPAVRWDLLAHLPPPCSPSA